MHSSSGSQGIGMASPLVCACTAACKESANLAPYLCGEHLGIGVRQGWEQVFVQLECISSHLGCPGLRQQPILITSNGWRQWGQASTWLSHEGSVIPCTQQPAASLHSCTPRYTTALPTLTPTVAITTTSAADTDVQWQQLPPRVLQGCGYTRGREVQQPQCEVRLLVQPLYPVQDFAQGWAGSCQTGTTQDSAAGQGAQLTSRRHSKPGGDHPRW